MKIDLVKQCRPRQYDDDRSSDRGDDLLAVNETMPTRERILDASAGLFRRQGAAATASGRIRLVCADVFATWQQVVADGLTGSGIRRERALDLATQFLIALEGALILSRAQRDEAALRRAGEVVAAAVEAEFSRRP